MRADGVDHRVVALSEPRLHVLADDDVAEEPKPGIECVFELGTDRLDLRMVGRHAGAHQTPRRRQHFEHVDPHVGVVFLVRELQQ